MAFLGLAIDWAIRLTILVVIIDVILGYFMDPYQPVRQMFDRVVEPMLAPIRRIMPRTGAIDFSPMVLVVILLLLNSFLQALLR